MRWFLLKCTLLGFLLDSDLAFYISLGNISWEQSGRRSKPRFFEITSKPSDIRCEGQHGAEVILLECISLRLEIPLYGMEPLISNKDWIEHRSFWNEVVDGHIGRSNSIHWNQTGACFFPWWFLECYELSEWDWIIVQLLLTKNQVYMIS